MTKNLEQSFNQYLQTRYNKADAITAGQKLEVIATLRRETRAQGRIPLADGVVRVDVENPIIAAALDGRAVSMDGRKATKKKDTGTAAAEMGTGAKVGILVGVLLLPILGLIVFMVLRGGRGEEAEISAINVTETAAAVLTMTAQPTPTETATDAPTETPAPPATVTPLPTSTPLPPVEVLVTPTLIPALAIADRGGLVAEGMIDPASIEMAGFAFVLTAGSPANGTWQPNGAEWLQGTELRRVISVPYSPDLLNALFAMSNQDSITLRLRGGLVVNYALVEVVRVSRTEIDILQAAKPSIAVILHGEDSNARWVVIGEAIQEQEDFSLIETNTAPAHDLVVTTDQTITAGQVTLTVNECEQVADINGRPPAGSNQQYVMCQITLEAAQDTTYTGQELAVTEFVWASSAGGDWSPVQLVPLPGGDLEAGTPVTLDVYGLVNGSNGSVTSQPVLLFDWAGLRYLIQILLS